MKPTHIAGIAILSLLSLLAVMIQSSQAQSTETTPSPTFRETIRFITATPKAITATPTASMTPSQSPTPSITPTATVTTNYDDLRQMMTDDAIGMRFVLDDNCFLVDNEITGRVILRNLSQEALYIYLPGQIALSINNSSLLPDFEPRAPSRREEFLLLEPGDEVQLLEIEDLGLFVQGMGSESGIDFFASGTIFGLPVGQYWVTAAYTNPHTGLEEQVDGSYLIPEAAWRGRIISRELRFQVVDNRNDCPN